MVDPSGWFSLYQLLFDFSGLILFASISFFHSKKYLCNRSIYVSDFWCAINQSYPTVYEEDLKEMEGDMGKVVSVWESAKEKEVKETNMLWERTYDQPYGKAGGEVVLESDKIGSVKQPIYWEVSGTDVNTKYKSMLPRFLLEVWLALTLFLSVFVIL